MTTTTMPVAPAPTVRTSSATVAPAGELTVQGSGFPSGDVDVLLLSRPVLLATATVGADGNFVVTVTIPTDTAPGRHLVVAQSGDGAVRAETEIFVTSQVSQPTRLSRTGSEVTGPALLASALVVVGLMLVGGPGLGELQRVVRRTLSGVQRGPTR